MPTNTVVGSARAIFTISLVAAATEEVRVDWATKDGTALSGRDYETNSGTVAFAPGETTKTVEIFVHGRTVETEDRVFYVLLDPPVNALLADEIGACVIHVDTTGTVPVVSVIIPRGEKGLTGDSAYQIALNNGFVGTEAQWLASLRPSPEELAPLVAPLINAGVMNVTAKGTESLAHPDTDDLAGFAGRGAYMALTRKATAPALTAGVNVVPVSSFVGETFDPGNATGFKITILRGANLVSLPWRYLPATSEIRIEGALADDIPMAVQQDVGQGQAKSFVVEVDEQKKSLDDWLSGLRARASVLESIVPNLASHDWVKGAAMVALFGQGSVQTALKDSRRVEDFGPVGEGNDTPTLHRALAWMTAVKGRELVFEPGRIYIQGPGETPVIFQGATYYPARFNIDDADLWSIVGNGAVIQASPTLPDNQFNRGFYVSRCKGFKAQDLTYDGRLDARTPFGGDAFNLGNELTGNRKSGLTFIDCHDFTLMRVVGTRCMMDGFTVAGPDETADDYIKICSNFVLFQCKGTFNYRQGTSVIGGRDGLFIGGSYSDTGTIKGTLPMAGIDIEASFANRPNVNIGMIGVEFARNFTGLAMTLAAQSCWALQPQFRENRAYGVLMSQAADCTVTEGRLFHTLASAAAETYAVYIMASNSCSVTGLKATMANPHRGAFIGSGSIDCTVETSKFLDISQSSNASFAQFLCRVTADTERCTIRGNQFTDSSGLGQAVYISSPSAICDDNRVASKWGAAGGGGIYIEAVDSCKGNIVAGVNPGASADGAGIGLAPGATSVRQIGPNIDYLKPRLGAQIRRRGFTADVLQLSEVIDLPSIAINGSHNFDRTVMGAMIGDKVVVSLSDPQYLFAVGRVLSANTVRVTVVNTFTAVDPTPQTLRITVTANDA